MNDERATAGPAKPKWIILLLVLVFLLPMTLSYLLFYFTPLGQSGGEASHGTLIDPPRQLPDLTLRKAGGDEQDTTGLYGKWSLVYLVRDQCDDACDKNLYRMRQLRLAQGKRGTRVQRVLLNLGTERIELNREQLREYAGQLISGPESGSGLLKEFRVQENDQPLDKNRLYLVDPRGFLMMSYPADTEPGGIIDDMKRLLRYTSAG